MIKKYSSSLFSIHSWAGIIAGLGILLLSITGSILLFEHEIDAAFYEPELPAAQSPQTVLVDKSVAQIRAAYPNWNIRIYLAAHQAEQPLLFDLRRPGKKMHVYTNPTTGAILKEQPERSSITMIALKLHYSLMAGLGGRIIILVLGLLFLVSLLTGLYLYRKKIWKILSLNWKRKERTGRKRQAFWHNVTGTWVLLFNFIFAITGLYLSYLVVANGLRVSQQPTLPDPPPISISLDETLRKIIAAHPHFTPSYLRLPTQSGAPVRVYGSRTDDFFLFDAFANTISIDADDGSTQHISLMRNQSLSTRVAATLKPLHAGSFGGLWVRIVYMLAGLSIPVLSITGYMMNWRLRQ